MTRIFSILLVILISSSVYSDSVKVAVTSDSYINSLNATNNYATDTFLTIREIAGYYFSSVLECDTTGWNIDTDANSIDSASLNLYCHQGSATDRNIALCRLLKPFEDATVTWNSWKATQDQSEALTCASALVTGWADNGSTGCTIHEDASDVTFISNSTTGEEEYSIDNTANSWGIIDSVVIFWRDSTKNTGKTSLMYVAVHVGSDSSTTSTFQPAGTWTNSTWNLTTAPSGSAWTSTDVDAMTVAFVETSTGGGGSNYVSEFNVTVYGSISFSWGTAGASSAGDDANDNTGDGTGNDRWSTAWDNVTSVPDDSWHRYNVDTSWARRLADDDANSDAGMILRVGAGTGWEIRYTSIDGGSTANDPYLVIYYSEKLGGVPDIRHAQDAIGLRHGQSDIGHRHRP